MAREAQYRFADLTLDTGRRRLTRGDEPIELAKLTYALLVALVEAAPNVLTHDDLVERVWGGRHTSPETVTQRVKLLRDALGDDAEQPRYVGLVRGQGYRLIPEVQSVPEATASLASTASLAVPPTAPISTPRSSRRQTFVAAAVVALLVAAAGLYFVGNYVRDRGAATAEAGSVAGGSRATPNAMHSVAVLPFANDSSDPEQQYFADGLSSELVNALSRIPDVEVRGIVSSFYFRGRNEPLTTIGRALDVGHVLSGSVQRSGARLRIRAELVDVATGSRLWGDTYERTLEDVFAIQDEITEHVAAALQITLGVGRLGRIPSGLSNVAAYDELLKGAGYLREVRVESLPLAVEHFERATQLDESSAVAWMSLARVYAAGAGNLPERALEWRRKAAEAVDRARALSPEMLDVLLWDAERSVDRGAWSEADALLDDVTIDRFPLLARQYGPNPQLWLFKGIFLLQVGRVREAIPFLEHGRVAEPLLGVTRRLLGDAYADTGALAAALAELDRGLDLGNDTAVLQGYAVAAALASRDRAEIDRRVAALWPSPATDAHLRMARFLDDPAGAVTELREYAATEPAAADLLTALVLAHWAGYYGDAATALALLRRIPRQLFTGDVALALWRPVFSDMRRLPEFSELVHELGLVDYWRAHGWSDFCRPTGDTVTCD